MKKSLIWEIIFFVFLIAIIIFFISFYNSSCGDGTSYGKCSSSKPYFCEKEVLIKRASYCGCPDIFNVSGNSCILGYNENPSVISFNYSLDSKKSNLNFVVFQEFYYASKELPRFVSEEFSRSKLKHKILENEKQREMILPLIVEIQNSAKSKKEQAEIAVSLVQNLEYDFENTEKSLLNRAFSWRYPYETLYEMKGVCGEKVDVLVLMLKELGFGVAIFYFPDANHEAVGIKCPFYKDFKDTGYCYIETTYPYEINDLTPLEIYNLADKFELIEIADGKTFF